MLSVHKGIMCKFWPKILILLQVIANCDHCTTPLMYIYSYIVKIIKSTNRTLKIANKCKKLLKCKLVYCTLGGYTLSMSLFLYVYFPVKTKNINFLRK